MKKRLKWIIAVVLVCGIFSLAVGCGDSGDPSDSSSASFSGTASDSTSENESVSSSDSSSEDTESGTSGAEAGTSSDSSSDDSCTSYVYGTVAKPVIYLYPEESTEVNVKLSFNGELDCTYPQYSENGWTVTANPDGTLVTADGREYSYLFWDGTSNVDYDMSKGFVVKGEDTEAFLQEKLEYMGLTPREYNEFIVYWLPLMQDNEYNLIAFQGEEYTDNAELEITPAPDSVLRVFMTFRALDAPVEVEEQQLDTFERSGFTVIEWGGTELR